MKRNSVTSSRVKSLGHEGETLEVEFNTGAVYQYTPVPKSVYDSLMQSAQIGKDIQAIINDKTIKCTKITS